MIKLIKSVDPGSTRCSPLCIYTLTVVQDFQINNGDKKFALLINVAGMLEELEKKPINMQESFYSVTQNARGGCFQRCKSKLTSITTPGKGRIMQWQQVYTVQQILLSPGM